MSGFLKRNTKTVNPAGGVNPASNPNVGQYGWTNYDAANVNQLIQYVNMAQEAAQSAKDSADYVASKFGELQSFIDYIEVIYGQIGPVFDNIDIIYKDIVLKHKEIINMHTDAGRFSNEAIASAAAAKVSEEKALISEHSSAGHEHNSEINKDEAIRAAQEARDIAEELRKGQVYRGTWNIEANAGYPTPPDTNSVWDIVLNESSLEYDYDNQKWYWGDRLLYLKDENKFSQIESGSTVISVNGKSGAVTLNPSDIGAVNKTGDTVTGTLTIDNAGAGLHIKRDDYPNIILESKNQDETKFKYIEVTPSGGLDFITRDSSGTNKGVITLDGDKTGMIYHTGNRPTPDEIGAPSLAGLNVLQSTLAVRGDSQFGESADGLSWGGPSVTNKMSNFIEVVTPANAAHNSSTGIVFHNRSSGTAGLMYKQESATRSHFDFIADGADWDVRVNGNKVYHQGFKPTPDELGAITDAEVNAKLTSYVPLSGGTLTGPLVLKKGVPGVLVVNETASISYQTFSGAIFHNYAADASTMAWSQGNSGENRLMTLSSGGQLSVEGPVYSRYGQISQSRNSSVSIGLETPEASAPYISSKTSSEASTTVALRFGQTEISVESNKRLSAPTMRVGVDAGLKFAPTAEMSGYSWGMGINDTSRNLSVNRYHDGVWQATPVLFNPDGSTHFSNNVYAAGSFINNGGYSRIERAGNPMLEWHIPGVAASVMYLSGADRLRIGNSNGAGGETQMIAELSTHTCQFAGRVQSNMGSGRSWNAMGTAAFISPQQDVGDGHLIGTVSSIAHYPGAHILEYSYGVINSLSAETGGNVFWANDGGTFNRVWYMYNNGTLASPTFHITADGNVWGGIYGSNYLVSWVVGNFAPASDGRHKTILGESKLSAVAQINKMKFHEYVWKDSEVTKQLAKRSAKVNRIGVIAQEIEEIDPTYTRDIETFNEDGSVKDSTKVLDTANLLAVALKAIQEQQVQINELKEKLNEFILK